MHERQKSEAERALHRRIIRFLRHEVERRYHIDYLEEVPGVKEEQLLEGIDQETIEEVKSFFQEVLYPTGEERSRRDESVEAVVEILNSRGRLMALLPRMPGFLWKHGGSLVTAARAGLEVLSTFRYSIKVEALVTENLRELCEEEGIDIEQTEEIPEELLRRAFARVPRRKTEEMIEHLKKLTELGMRQGTVDATREVLKAIRELIASEEEGDAIGYAVHVMEELDALVRERSRRELRRFVRIAELTERHYHLEELKRWA
jgi:hypothetical protein